MSDDADSKGGKEPLKKGEILLPKEDESVDEFVARLLTPRGLIMADLSNENVEAIKALPHGPAFFGQQGDTPSEVKDGESKDEKKDSSSDSKDATSEAKPTPSEDITFEEGKEVPVKEIPVATLEPEVLPDPVVETEMVPSKTTGAGFFSQSVNKFLRVETGPAYEQNIQLNDEAGLARLSWVIIDGSGPAFPSDDVQTSSRKRILQEKTRSLAPITEFTGTLSIEEDEGYVSMDGHGFKDGLSAHQKIQLMKILPQMKTGAQDVLDLSPVPKGSLDQANTSLTHAYSRLELAFKVDEDEYRSECDVKGDAAKGSNALYFCGGDASQLYDNRGALGGQSSSLAPHRLLSYYLNDRTLSLMQFVSHEPRVITPQGIREVSYPRPNLISGAGNNDGSVKVMRDLARNHDTPLGRMLRQESGSRAKAFAVRSLIASEFNHTGGLVRPEIMITQKFTSSSPNDGLSLAVALIELSATPISQVVLKDDGVHSLAFDPTASIEAFATLYVIHPERFSLEGALIPLLTRCFRLAYHSAADLVAGNTARLFRPETLEDFMAALPVRGNLGIYDRVLGTSICDTNLTNTMKALFRSILSRHRNMDANYRKVPDLRVWNENLDGMEEGDVVHAIFEHSDARPNVAGIMPTVNDGVAPVMVQTVTLEAQSRLTDFLEKLRSHHAPEKMRMKVGNTTTDISHISRQHADTLRQLISSLQQGALSNFGKTVVSIGTAQTRMCNDLQIVARTPNWQPGDVLGTTGVVVPELIEIPGRGALSLLLHGVTSSDDIIKAGRLTITDVMDIPALPSLPAKLEGAVICTRTAHSIYHSPAYIQAAGTAFDYYNRREEVLDMIKYLASKYYVSSYVPEIMKMATLFYDSPISFPYQELDDVNNRILNATYCNYDLDSGAVPQCENLTLPFAERSSGPVFQKVHALQERNDFKGAYAFFEPVGYQDIDSLHSRFRVYWKTQKGFVLPPHMLLGVNVYKDAEKMTLQQLFKLARDMQRDHSRLKDSPNYVQEMRNAGWQYFDPEGIKYINDDGKCVDLTDEPRNSLLDRDNLVGLHLNVCYSVDLEEKNDAIDEYTDPDLFISITRRPTTTKWKVHLSSSSIKTYYRRLAESSTSGENIESFANRTGKMEYIAIHLCPSVNWVDYVAIRNDDPKMLTIGERGEVSFTEADENIVTPKTPIDGLLEYQTRNSYLKVVVRESTNWNVERQAPGEIVRPHAYRMD